jgi:hypothetical protein
VRRASTVDEVEMPRYVVQRTFSEPWDTEVPLEELCRRIVERNGDDVTWLHSYVSDDGRTWFCAYEARSPEALRATSARNGLPLDSITSVRLLDPYPYHDH